MKIFLHIGTEKTGTTSVPFFLNKYRDLLSNEGLLYPTAAGGVNSYHLLGIALDIQKKCWLFYG